MHLAQGAGAAASDVGGEGLAKDKLGAVLVGEFHEGELDVVASFGGHVFEFEGSAGGEHSPGGGTHLGEHGLEFGLVAGGHVGVVGGPAEGLTKDLAEVEEPFGGEVGGGPPEAQQVEHGAAQRVAGLVFAEADEELMVGEVLPDGATDEVAWAADGGISGESVGGALERGAWGVGVVGDAELEEAGSGSVGVAIPGGMNPAGAARGDG